jgi:hypothetical protein
MFSSAWKPLSDHLLKLHNEHGDNKRAALWTALSTPA